MVIRRSRDPARLGAARQHGPKGSDESSGSPAAGWPIAIKEACDEWREPGRALRDAI